MREIKFKGKDIKTGEWRYGWYVGYSEHSGYIYGDYVDKNEVWEVLALTVGQFTGLFDKSGREIYEGDIIRYNIGAHYPTSISSIEFLNGWFERYKEGGTDILQYTENYAEIIGNRFDNPELLEGAK